MKSAKAALGATAVVLLAGLLTGCGSSTDGFVEEGSQNKDTMEQNAIKSVMQAMGAVESSDRPIEQNPRAPLVIPPNRSNLPAPAADAGSARADFPRNPEDVIDEQRRIAAGKEGTPGRVMTPEELSKYAISGAAQPQHGSDPKDAGRPLTPDELRGQGAIQLEAIKRAAHPAGRKTLVEPPDVYRQPSPNAPVAAPEEKSSKWWPF